MLAASAPVGDLGDPPDGVDVVAMMNERSEVMHSTSFCSTAQLRHGLRRAELRAAVSGQNQNSYCSGLT